MPSVTIDTCVLAAPPLTATHTDIEFYVETLLDWKKLLDEPWVSIYMSEKASEAMFAADVYPLRQALKSLFMQNGFQVYDANTVALLIQQLLTKTPYLETYFKIGDVLPDNVETKPDLLSIHSCPILADELARIVVILAILRSSCKNPTLDHSLIIKPWEGSKLVKVKALIYEIETTRDDISDLPDPPEFFIGEVLTCTNFREFIMSLDEEAIWKTAIDEEGLTLATNIAVYKDRLDRKIDPDWENIPYFCFNKKFLSYVLDCENDGVSQLIEKTLRSLVETIDGQNLSAIHPKRTGKGGNDPQQTRGRDKAWRRDIDREYHLHYWQCDDGTIEFASVGPHNMFECPE